MIFAVQKIILRPNFFVLKTVYIYIYMYKGHIAGLCGREISRNKRGEAGKFFSGHEGDRETIYLFYANHNFFCFLKLI